MPTVLITGAKRGIGRGLVDRFNENGWQVIATGRDATKTELANRGEQITAMDVDVADDQSIAALATKLAGQPLDLLINNAGVYDVPRNQLDTVTRDAWLHEMSVNSMAPLLVTRALLPNLLAGQRRQVAVISSKMGSITDNTSGSSYMYRSSKAAANAVLRSLSHDLANDGFTCVTLHPGWVQTDMGGPSATTTVEQSTTGLANLLINLKSEQNGRFFNFDGTELPW